MGGFGDILLTSAINKEVQWLPVGAAGSPDLGPEPQEVLQAPSLDHHCLLGRQISFWKT
jgi:hypothetical protein